MTMSLLGWDLLDALVIFMPVGAARFAHLCGSQTSSSLVNDALHSSSSCIKCLERMIDTLMPSWILKVYIWKAVFTISPVPFITCMCLFQLGVVATLVKKTQLPGGKPLTWKTATKKTRWCTTVSPWFFSSTSCVSFHHNKKIESVQMRAIIAHPLKCCVESQWKCTWNPFKQNGSSNPNKSKEFSNR